MTVGIRLGEVKCEVNRTSVTGKNNIIIAISALERAAAEHDPSIDPSAGYTSLSLHYEGDRSTTSAYISRDLGKGAILLSVSGKDRDSDRDRSESYAKLLFEQEDEYGYAVSDTMSYWAPRHVSNFPRRGDIVAEFTLNRIRRITPDSVQSASVAPKQVDSPHLA